MAELVSALDKLDLQKEIAHSMPLDSGQLSVVQSRNARVLPLREITIASIVMARPTPSRIEKLLNIPSLEKGSRRTKLYIQILMANEAQVKQILAGSDNPKKLNPEEKEDLYRKADTKRLEPWDYWASDCTGRLCYFGFFPDIEQNGSRLSTDLCRKHLIFQCREENYLLVARVGPTGNHLEDNLEEMFGGSLVWMVDTFERALIRQRLDIIETQIRRYRDGR